MKEVASLLLIVEGPVFESGRVVERRLSAGVLPPCKLGAIKPSSITSEGRELDGLGV